MWITCHTHYASNCFDNKILCETLFSCTLIKYCLLSCLILLLDGFQQNLPIKTWCMPPPQIKDVVQKKIKSKCAENLMLRNIQLCEQGELIKGKYWIEGSGFYFNCFALTSWLKNMRWNLLIWWGLMRSFSNTCKKKDR